MKKYLDKLKSIIHINKNLFVFLLVIVIIGITAGAFFSIIISSDDKTLVSNYLNDFFNLLKTGQLNYNNSIINSTVFTIGFALLIWILGISIIGFFIIIFMLFIKSFILGFSVGSIILNYKLKGILMSFVYIFPHQIINIFIYILLSAYALIVSFKIIRTFTKQKTLEFKNIFNKYIKILIFSTIILLFTSLYDIYIMPRLFNFLLNILK